jgi:hypothetical protein
MNKGQTSHQTGITVQTMTVSNSDFGIPHHARGTAKN